MGTLYVLLVLCYGNQWQLMNSPQWGQILRSFIFVAKYAAEQIVQSMVTWDAMMRMRYHSNIWVTLYCSDVTKSHSKITLYNDTVHEQFVYLWVYY